MFRRIWLRVKLPAEDLAIVDKKLLAASCAKKMTPPSIRTGCGKSMVFLPKSCCPTR
jgi:hypothetical protein